MTADNDLLGQLHDSLAKDMLELVKKAKENKEPLSPQEWNAIAKFLKDNNIEASPGIKSPANSLAKELPAFEEDDEIEGNPLVN